MQTLWFGRFWNLEEMDSSFHVETFKVPPLRITYVRSYSSDIFRPLFYLSKRISLLLRPTSAFKMQRLMKALKGAGVVVWRPNGVDDEAIVTSMCPPPPSVLALYLVRLLL